MIKTEDQKNLLELTRKPGLWIVSDEVYALINYGSTHATSFCEVMEQGDRVIVVKSFSKSWTMTRWRHRWKTAPKEIESQIEKLTEYNIVRPLAFVQYAVIMVIMEGEDSINERAECYLKLHSLFDE